MDLKSFCRTCLSIYMKVFVDIIITDKQINYISAKEDDWMEIGYEHKMLIMSIIQTFEEVKRFFGLVLEAVTSLEMQYLISEM